MLNKYFVPVYVDLTYLENNPDTAADELAAVREGLIAGVSLYRTAGGGWNTP